MIQPPLYSLRRIRQTGENSRCCSLHLDAGHFIYRAHFPGHPVTPGACMTDISLRLTEEAVGKPLRITCIRNIKFLALVQPAETPDVDVELSWERTEDLAISCKVTFVSGERTFVRMSLLMAEDTAPRSEEDLCRIRLGHHPAAIVIPTYNHNGTVWKAVRAAIRYCSQVIVTDDGSVPAAGSCMPEDLREQVECIVCDRNRGKGRALELGFERAAARGCTHVLTMDADLQHRPEDLPALAAAAAERPDALVLGCRPMEQDGKPLGNTLANRFSNFWVRVQTGRRVSDTQTGFRIYPLQAMKGIRLFSSRYEAEVYWLVRLLWRRTGIAEVPVHVDYHPEGGRISHFGKHFDFLRISLLNSCLCIAAVFYGYPSMWLRRRTK